MPPAPRRPLLRDHTQDRKNYTDPIFCCLLYEDGIGQLAEVGGKIVTKRRGLSAGAACEVIEAGDQLGHFDLVRCRVRWFTECGALGGESFLQQVLGEAGERMKLRLLPAG